MRGLRPSSVDVESGEAAGWVGLQLFPDVQSFALSMDRELHTTGQPAEYRFETIVDYPPQSGDFLLALSLMAKSMPTSQLPGAPIEVITGSDEGFRLLLNQPVSIP